ncbi:ATP-binding cassette domain-containing protein [Finegoldia magna]|uniref:ABC transporter ATP-binding protein n=1 Tax=Finegoldia magna TaxID=1260 RepID=UPI0032BFB6F5
MNLELKHVNKSFGDNKVLTDISFKVESGRAFGFLGRNGAGKTTTMRIITDVLSADSGQVLINGSPINYNEVNIGYLPEERGLYSNEKVFTQLYYFARLKGTDRRSALQNVRYWLDRFDLAKYKNRKLSTLSKGLRQKVQIISALLNDPDILVLDEPFSGLDPINAHELKLAVGEFIQNQKIVIFSSHLMSYVEEFCRDICVIEEGRIILNGDLNEIKNSMAEKKMLLNANNMGIWELKELLEAENLIYPDAVVREFKLLVRLTENVTKEDILEFMMLNQIDINCFSQYEPSLQDVFVSKVGVTE